MRIRLMCICVAWAACGPEARPSQDGGDGADASTLWPDGGGPDEFIDAAPPQACEKMDILFVIDNSGSMSEEQVNLIANFPDFATLIDSYITDAGDLLDYRIAVTTAGRDVSYELSLPPPFENMPFVEAGDNGAFRRGCGLEQPWIERGDADVSGTFSCIADVGTGGPGAEMPLLGLEWSLNQRVADGTNAGFLREDALLAVVMITDQDDCSRNDDDFIIDGTSPTCYDPSDSNIIPLSHYLDFLDQIKGARGRWASSVIAGVGPGSCTSAFGEAAEATRMLDFVTQAGDNTVLSSICDGDLTSALNDALDQFEESCDSFPPVD